MALTLGTTGMDSKTEADVRSAFNTANNATGHHWVLTNEDSADFVVVDMDSLYGPMSWIRLHAAGRQVIGLTAMEKTQTDYRLSRPIDPGHFTALLREIAGDTPADATVAPIESAPAVSTPAPAPSDQLPDAHALPDDEVDARPDEAPAMATIPVTAAVPEPAPEADVESQPQSQLPPDRPLASWLTSDGLERRVRLQRGDAPVLLIDPRSKVYHGPTTLKPLAACFEGTLLIGDFDTPDAAAWETEAAKLGVAQPLARLQWLGGLLGGSGQSNIGLDPEGKYRLTKWPQTEREYPKHFRIATAMMKGPSTLDDVCAASGVDRAEVADFINANLATGYAELVLPPAPEPDQPAKSGGGLFGRMRGR